MKAFLVIPTEVAQYYVTKRSKQQKLWGSQKNSPCKKWFFFYRLLLWFPAIPSQLQSNVQQHQRKSGVILCSLVLHLARYEIPLSYLTLLPFQAKSTYLFRLSSKKWHSLSHSTFTAIIMPQILIRGHQKLHAKCAAREKLVFLSRYYKKEDSFVLFTITEH